MIWGIITKSKVHWITEWFSVLPAQAKTLTAGEYENSMMADLNERTCDPFQKLVRRILLCNT